MKTFDIRRAGSIAALAFMAACGGETGTGQASSAALGTPVPARAADCEAEGCDRPRIIDGLAEQYRAATRAAPAEPAAAPAATPPAPAAPG